MNERKAYLYSLFAVFVYADFNTSCTLEWPQVTENVAHYTIELQ